jgi:uncharacterized protein (DUF1330 family)
MTTYVITDIRVTDPVRYEDYKVLSSSSAALYGGKFLVRGGAHETLEGDWQPNRVVILQFPSADHARKWWSSPEYEAAKAIRQEAAESQIIMVEGTE